MPTLSTDKQAAVISALVEGSSIRSTERMTGVSRNAIGKMVLRFGRASDRLMHERVRRVECSQLQLDEVWAFIGKKRNHVRKTDDPAEVGDIWTWVALDPNTKLVPGYYVGKRTERDAVAFTRRVAARVEGRVQISTDKLAAYRWAIHTAFGSQNVDYGRIVKRYQVDASSEGRYSPPKCMSISKDVVFGDPDEDQISTSLVERSNLTMRMSMRRMTRLTNGFSKKRESFEAAVSMHFAHYNFVRKHSTIKTTPAVEAGLADRPMTMGEFVEYAGTYGH